MKNLKFRYGKIINAYKNTAIVVFNIVVLLILVEVSLGLFRYSKHNLFPTKLQLEPINNDDKPVGMSFKYAPWVQFKGTEDRKTIPNTYSSSDGNKDPGPLRIYFFGGSTMHGTPNVADSETIPSQFVSLIRKKQSEIPPIHVVNYGNGCYYSAQELVYLFNLIADGQKPDIVIFLDGLNDLIQPSSSYYRYPFFTKSFEYLIDHYRTQAVIDFIQGTNTFYVFRRLGLTKQLGGFGRLSAYKIPEGISSQEVFHKIKDNYLSTINLAQVLCKALEIEQFFFIQPVPFYNYTNRANDTICDQRSFVQFPLVYPVLEKIAEENESLAFLGGLLKDYSGKPFVDGFHYSPEFNKVIAAEILNTILPHLLTQK